MNYLSNSTNKLSMLLSLLKDNKDKSASEIQKLYDEAIAKTDAKTRSNTKDRINRDNESLQTKPIYRLLIEDEEEEMSYRKSFTIYKFLYYMYNDLNGEVTIQYELYSYYKDDNIVRVDHDIESRDYNDVIRETIKSDEETYLKLSSFFNEKLLEDPFGK